MQLHVNITQNETNPSPLKALKNEVRTPLRYCNLWDDKHHLPFHESPTSRNSVNHLLNSLRSIPLYTTYLFVVLHLLCARKSLPQDQSPFYSPLPAPPTCRLFIRTACRPEEMSGSASDRLGDTRYTSGIPAELRGQRHVN